jgi:hypothetical protein
VIGVLSAARPRAQRAHGARSAAQREREHCPLLYLLDQNGDFQPGPAVGVNVQAWAFIDANGDGSNDIVGVTWSGDVWLWPELRQTQTTPPPKASLPTLSHLKLTPTTFRAGRTGASHRARDDRHHGQLSGFHDRHDHVHRRSRGPGRQARIQVRYSLAPPDRWKPALYAFRSGARQLHPRGRRWNKPLPVHRPDRRQNPPSRQLSPRRNPKDAARDLGRTARSRFSIIP